MGSKVHQNSLCSHADIIFCIEKYIEINEQLFARQWQVSQTTSASGLQFTASCSVWIDCIATTFPVTDLVINVYFFFPSSLDAVPDATGLPYTSFDHSKAHFYRYDEQVSLCLERLRWAVVYGGLCVFCMSYIPYEIRLIECKYNMLLCVRLSS